VAVDRPATRSADNPEQRPFLILALNNLGRHLEDRGRLAEALANLDQEPAASSRMQPDVIHHWVFLRAKQCLWPVYEPMPGLNEETMRQPHLGAGHDERCRKARRTSSRPRPISM
jgi:predicted O-linked N-acetylglucosamine transferase (SPINDLY family)